VANRRLRNRLDRRLSPRSAGINPDCMKRQIRLCTCHEHFASNGAEVMKRFLVLVGVIVLSSGCTSVADRAQWEEAMKDLRGENWEMGSRSSSMSRMNDQSFRVELGD